MTIHIILTIFFGSIILILLPFIFKTLNFKNSVSVNDFSNLKFKEKPKLGVGFYWFAFSPKIPNNFYNKCYNELYKLDKKNPPRGEEVYAFAFEKYTGENIFKFRALGWVILIPIIVTIIAFLIPCDK